MTDNVATPAIAEVAERLCEVIAAENDALSRHRVAEATALQNAKTTLARLYADHMKALHDDPSVLGDLTEEGRGRLAGLAARLDALAEINARLLKAAMEANQRLVKAVVESARKQTVAATPYGRTGGLRHGRSGGQVSLAFNRTL